MAEVIRNSPTTLQLNDLESIAGMSFRALEGSNHEVRCAVAHLLGQSAAAALTPPKGIAGQRGTTAGSAVGSSGSGPGSGGANGAVKVASVEEVLSIISTGFLRGGGGFLKGTGEMIKGPAATSREVRVGVTMVIFLHLLADNSILKNVNQSKRRNLSVLDNFR